MNEWIDKVSTPCYVVDEEKLIRNLIILQNVEKASGCHILLAQKAFSAFSFYPLIGSYISGTTASGLYEARLGKEEMGGECHVFAPAYSDADMAKLAAICDHISFNSFAQLKRHKDVCLSNGISLGLRINPEHSTQEGHAIYDPCAPGSRLGVTYANFLMGCGELGCPLVCEGAEEFYQLPAYIEGLHFHTLCEQNSDDLVSTFKAFEAKFAPYLRQVKWLNLGGGHHITREDYDVDALLELIKYIKSTYNLEVYLEPGEAIALNAGYLVTEVMDIVHNDIDIAILDASAACHMPDVLEMPYRPPLRSAGEAGQKAHTYRLSSYTCLAGDIIGDYSFEGELRVGDRLVFEDMAIYSMVKNNTFNGIPLPSIYALKAGSDLQLIKQFGYEDFKGRLS